MASLISCAAAHIETLPSDCFHGAEDVAHLELDHLNLSLIFR